MICRWKFVLMLGAFAALSLWAAAEPSAEELETQRRRLETLRKNPEELARLREAYQAFQALPEQRRAAIIKLDADIHEFSAKKLERYFNMLERYADWLERLKSEDPKAYQEIKNASDASARIALIKERRDQEWMASQPRAVREAYGKLRGDARAAFVIKLRTEEREKHENWLLAKRFWSELDGKQVLPCRLSDFAVYVKDKTKPDGKKLDSNKVKDYVEHYLLPYLQADEKAKLEEAEGRWPDFPRALVELARKHPAALPPEQPEKLPMHLSQLPAPIRDRVTVFDKKSIKKKAMPELKNFEGRPEFATKVVEIGTKKGAQPFENEVWACNFKALQQPMRDFVEKELKPKLDGAERIKLLNAEGTWPFYPQAIQELSKKYKLQPPWLYLPEPAKWKWDEYRNPKYKSLTTDTMKDK